MTEDDFRATVAAIWRIESPKLIATLSRRIGDLERAEEFAQDAFVAALTQWRDGGIPRTPGAWLMTAAKRRAIDQLRRDRIFDRKAEMIVRELSALESEIDLAAGVDKIDDDLLRLMFVACHPVLAKDARVALTLKLLGGLTTAEIARAFLTSEITIAQRIVRAKRTLSKAHVPFEIPVGPERARRLESILEAIYLLFNEGYAATAGDDVVRPQLVEDALRIGRVLARLMPMDAEVHGLAALMEIQASRMRARVAVTGEPILLLDQDRGKWNRLLIERGLASLACAETLVESLGPYGLQAAIAACHARARSNEETDWARIKSFYDELARQVPSPVVALNRAVAVGMAFGPQAALDIIDTLVDDPALRDYHLLGSVRGDLLFKLDRRAEAGAEFERAASIAQNTRDRAFLLSRAAACRRDAAPSTSSPRVGT